jgi:hypothetical protein
MIRQNLFHIFISQLIINHMSDFNVTKLENGDFEVTKSHQKQANFLYVVWVLFVMSIIFMSMSCSTNKSTFKTVRYCKYQMY